MFFPDWDSFLQRTAIRCFCCRYRFASGSGCWDLPEFDCLQQLQSTGMLLDLFFNGTFNSRQRSVLDLLKQQCLQILHQELFAPGNDAHRLWSEGLISRLLADPRMGGRNAGLLAVIETPEAMQAYLERGRSQDDVKRRSQRCIEAAELAARWLNR